MKYNVFYELEKYPEKCRECPCFVQDEYHCHNEYGVVADCTLGFMKGHDMRDFYGNIKFKHCKIEEDKRIKIL